MIVALSTNAPGGYPLPAAELRLAGSAAVTIEGQPIIDTFKIAGHSAFTEDLPP